MNLKARLRKLEQAKQAKTEQEQRELTMQERIMRLYWAAEFGGEATRARIAALLMDPESWKAGTLPPALA